MVDISETNLPGVGLRHEFTTRSGDRVGVITHRTGRRELLLYDREDPDACREDVRLEEDESHALAEVLGGSQVVSHLQTMLQQSVQGVTIDWLPVDASWSCAGRTIAETMLRAKTGVSIIAVIRDGESGETVPAPTPDVRLEAGDVIVVVGTPDGIRAAFAHLQGGAAG